MRPASTTPFFGFGIQRVLMKRYIVTLDDYSSYSLTKPQMQGSNIWKIVSDALTEEDERTTLGIFRRNLSVYPQKGLLFAEEGDELKSCEIISNSIRLEYNASKRIRYGEESFARPTGWPAVIDSFLEYAIFNPMVPVSVEFDLEYVVYKV